MLIASSLGGASAFDDGAQVHCLDAADARVRDAARFFFSAADGRVRDGRVGAENKSKLQTTFLNTTLHCYLL